MDTQDKSTHHVYSTPDNERLTMVTWSRDTVEQKRNLFSTVVLWFCNICVAENIELSFVRMITSNEGMEQPIDYRFNKR